MTDAQWFAEGKQLLLVQINAADQTKRVGNMLSGILKRDETEKQAPATTPAEHMKVLVENGASIIGGCCGTTPEFIRKVNKILGR